mmetsp:Transcript_105635/g.297154  ORF Transcript_105635/g.297154 Transcript_105635/m.297154 type:complete len:262 (-) Transcript_105635:209-994(-)|eukprot:CAMPEP_0117536738 /NCGR_PEP_ID=MMETSP0784-20121206/41606_1 /TAXON_ID=39447 /ORGANISM="" /LENGTH=261 /DNA_ID=CAMNT_0005333307 /DNA_START=127 /DNA_END=912 /DNA_ORIENTATION=+
MAAADSEVPRVFDGMPLIEAAQKLKEQANALVKGKKFNEAVPLYENAIATLDKADGHPMLRQEVEQMIALKALLYSNLAQSLLSVELFRRAVDAATECLRIDETNVKALYRRSQAYEALRKYDDALHDHEELQRLGGGGLSEQAVATRREALQAKKDEVDRAKAEESEEDECDNELVRMKERFDEIVEKYDLKDGNAASEVADWLVSGEWLVTSERVAKRWQMEAEDADDFLRWISKGLEFKIQNSQAQAQAAAQSPALDI